MIREIYWPGKGHQKGEARENRSEDPQKKGQPLEQTITKTARFPEGERTTYPENEKKRTQIFPDPKVRKSVLDNHGSGTKGDKKQKRGEDLARSSSG